MGHYALKVVLSALVIVAVTEIAKRSAMFGALVASLPLTSLLAMVWLYHDTGQVMPVANLARSVFWLVLPSLVLFLVLPVLLKHGLGFWLALGLSSAATIAAYGLMVLGLARFGGAW
ncbi:MAG: DUF3147 family protein [Gammaproteobacteria bacterium]|nr:DUF3147 family protein [Gammaproteobacteria bacterium]